MSQLKDPKIKLFGKTIKLPGEDSSSQDQHHHHHHQQQQQKQQHPPPCCSSSSSSPVVQDCSFNRDAGEQEPAKSIPCPKQDDDSTDKKEEDPAQPLTSEELKDSNVTPPTIEDSKPPSADTDVGSAKTSKTEEDQTDTSNSNEKTLKKPDKILPCPRCNSMDTKFCYFNNYNVNQPRHFCKNCQRYWTAGGTMRNVPVGAGRRKNKNSISQFRHLAVPESLHNGINHPVLNPNGTVLTFSSDVPLCESMASVLNIADKTIRNGLKAEDSGDGHSSRPHISNEEVVKNGSTKVMPNVDPFAQRVPVPFPVAPWPYPLTPTLGPASYPVPFYPTPVPYWGCAVPWVIPPAPTNHTPPSSGPISPTLGKHSREDNILKPDNAEEEQGSKESGPEKSLWVPKTLRIDDPGEAAKSSIWATLGIKNETSDSVGKGGIFKAFQGQESKSDNKSHVPETSTVLLANPAALSRSLSFHESS